MAPQASRGAAPEQARRPLPRPAARLSPADRGAADHGASQGPLQLPIPDLPPVKGELAFSEAAFSGAASTIMQGAHEHAANWGAYADTEGEAARRSWTDEAETHAAPRAIIQWARDQSERLAPHLRDQSRRAEDARAAYEQARTAVAKSVRQAAFVRQIRHIAVALDPTADDEQAMQ